MNSINYFLVWIFYIVLRSEAGVVNRYNWNFYMLCPSESDIETTTPVTGISTTTTTTTTTGKPPECHGAEVLEGAELYWRDFHGPSVPADAVLVGINHQDNKKVSMHIGQVLVHVDGAGIQPTSISNDSSKVISTYTTTINTDNNIKILCTNTPQHLLDQFLVWVPVKDIEDLDPEDLVVTGWERIKDKDDLGEYTYSGRSVHDGGIVVGKVVHENKGWRFFYAKNEGEIELDEDYEVLAYAKARENILFK